MGIRSQLPQYCRLVVWSSLPGIPKLPRGLWHALCLCFSIQNCNAMISDSFTVCLFNDHDLLPFSIIYLIIRKIELMCGSFFVGTCIFTDYFSQRPCDTPPHDAFSLFHLRKIELMSGSFFSSRGICIY